MLRLCVAKSGFTYGSYEPGALNTPARRAASVNVKSLTDLPKYDLDACYTIDPANFLSMGKSMPFEGWEVYGKCVKAIVNGVTVYNNSSYSPDGLEKSK